MLTRTEFDDIHLSVQEAMGYVALPVSFYHVSASKRNDPAHTDALYGEATGGVETPELYATLSASVRVKPKPEELTQLGLRADTSLLLFIPRREILDWESANGETLAITPGMECEFDGTRYSLSSEPRTDPLPSQQDDGTVSTDYIGMVIAAVTKADTGR